MKKQLLVIVLFIFTIPCFSQVIKDTTKKVHAVTRISSQNLRIIPGAKATVIRKNVVDLKLQLTRVNDSIALVKKDVDAIVDSMKNDLDNMSEMGETESLRLQMAMDRINKMMSTLSNILKKISDTQQSITQNLK